jgi:hypothetical protein
MMTYEEILQKTINACRNSLFYHASPIKDHAYYNRNKEDINKSNTYFLLAGLH